MMTTTTIELCHYCNNKAEFNDLAAMDNKFIIAGVCPKHLKNYGVS